jgi:hypothetical protein
VLGQVRLEGEQAAGQRRGADAARPVQGVVAEPERGPGAPDERVLEPARLDRVGERVAGEPRALQVGEALAERIVRVLKVLGDVADRLLRGRRAVV